MKEQIKIIYERKPNEKYQKDVEKFIAGEFHSKYAVSKGKKVDASLLPRFLALDGKKKLVGLASYQVNKSKKSCELVVIIVRNHGKGLGTRLIHRVEKAAREKGCGKVWLITTNDNLEAISFYTKRGYRLTEIHLNAMEISRKLKPQIPKIGRYGIPLMDEWEFTKELS